jgi:hypothetical protein
VGERALDKHTPNIRQALEFAINAIDHDDLNLGKAALEWVLEREPSNTIALLWMACTVPNEDEKRHYYSKIIS